MYCTLFRNAFSPACLTSWSILVYIYFSLNQHFLYFFFSRHAPCREPINPYYVNTGYAMAPATSTNDSEQQSMSSDADTISLTDSSVYVFPHHTPIMHKVVAPSHEGHVWLIVAGLSSKWRTEPIQSLYSCYFKENTLYDRKSLLFSKFSNWTTGAATKASSAH